MASIHLISVGKNKDKNYLALESDYLKRLKAIDFSVHEVKSCEEDLEREAKNVIAKIDQISKNNKFKLILLTEAGQKYDSQSFANSLLGQNNTVILVIGGAAGHGPKLYDLADAQLSLSALTYPHKMARLILIEQIYRAYTIFQNHPYHK